MFFLIVWQKNEEHETKDKNDKKTTSANALCCKRSEYELNKSECKTPKITV